MVVISPKSIIKVEIPQSNLYLGGPFPGGGEIMLNRSGTGPAGPWNPNDAPKKWEPGPKNGGLSMFILGKWGLSIQLSGLGEKLQENLIVHGKIYGFRLRFSLFCQPSDTYSDHSGLISSMGTLQWNNWLRPCYRQVVLSKVPIVSRLVNHSLGLKVPQQQRNPYDTRRQNFL